MKILLSRSSRCYWSKKQHFGTCPENEKNQNFYCLEGGSWKQNPYVRVSCRVQTTKMTTTTRITTKPTTTTKTTTRKTTTTKIATTTKRLTTTPSSKTSTKNGCCTKLEISNHGIKGAPSKIILHNAKDYHDGSHYKSAGKNTLYFVANGNYWSIGEEFNYARSSCYGLDQTYHSGSNFCRLLARRRVVQ